MVQAQNYIQWAFSVGLRKIHISQRSLQAAQHELECTRQHCENLLQERETLIEEHNNLREEYNKVLCELRAARDDAKMMRAEHAEDCDCQNGIKTTQNGRVRNMESSGSRRSRRLAIQ